MQVRHRHLHQEKANEACFWPLFGEEVIGELAGCGAPEAVVKRNHDFGDQRPNGPLTDAWLLGDELPEAAPTVFTDAADDIT